MVTYLPLKYDTPVLPEYFLSNAYLLSNRGRFTKSVLRILLLSSFGVSSIDYYLVSLPIHKIRVMCGIFSAIYVLLTTENSDDLEIRVPDGSSH